MATTSSCSSRRSCEAGTSAPRIRIIGKLPTLTCRSEAPLSTAILRRSLTCITPGLSALLRSRCSRLPGADGLEPAVRVRRLALHNLEETLLKGLGYGPAASTADLGP